MCLGESVTGPGHRHTLLVVRRPEGTVPYVVTPVHKGRPLERGLGTLDPSSASRGRPLHGDGSIDGGEGRSKDSSSSSCVSTRTSVLWLVLRSSPG